MKNQLLVIAFNLIFINCNLLAQNILGIDVANHQGTINWSQVSAAGKVFAFVKATEGFTYDDPKFITNMTNGNNAGVKMGAYHFARPLNNSAINEANHFVSVAGAYIGAGYLPPVLDLEDDPTPLPNGTPLPIPGLSTWVQTWMTTVENATGVAPILYTNSYYASQLSSSLNSYKLWIANPNTSPTTPPTNIGNWTTWAFKQYSWTGSVSGISGDVDLDVFNGTATQFNTLIMSGSTSPDLTKVSDNMQASGNSVTFTVTVKNIGYATAGASSLGFLASVNSNLTFPSTLGANTVPALAPGASYTITRTINLCDAAMVLNSGTYFVGYKIDRLEEITESDETNNVWVWGNNPVTINCSTGGGSGTGSVQAYLVCNDVISAGGQWRIDGGAWTNTNQTISNLPAGNHIMSFKDIPNWNTPAPYSFSLASGENKVVSHPQTQYSKLFALTLSSNPSNGGTTGGAGSIIVGCGNSVNVTISAVPNSGWQFDNWTENGVIVSPQPTIPISISNDRHLVANFSQIIFYDITVIANPVEGGFVYGNGTLPSGSSVLIEASPKPCWQFLNWTENGSIISTNPSFTIPVNANRVLTANFTAITGSFPPTPNVVANGSTTLCPGQTVTLNVDNVCSGCSVNWSNGQTGTNLIVSQPGSYTATMSNTCGTGNSSNAISVTGGSLPTTPNVVANGSTTLCPGQTVTLNVDNVCSGCSVNWSNGQNGTSLVVSQPGSYTATMSNTCGTGNSSNAISVTSGSLPTAPNVVANGSTTLCPGQTVTLNVDNVCSGCSVNWSNGQTGTSLVVSQPGNYTATMSNSCGTGGSSNAISVTSGSLPTAPNVTASGSTTLCPGQTVTLNVDNVCSGCAVNWSNGQNGTSLVVSQPGSYTATMSNACGTGGSSNTIIVQENDFIPVFQVNNMCYFAAPAGSNYQWFIDGVMIPGATEQYYTAEENGYYSLTMTNLDGCMGTSTDVFANCFVSTDEVSPYGSLLIYPNPAIQNVFLTLTLKSNINIVIDICSVDGQIIKRSIPQTRNGEIVNAMFDVAALPSGSYFCLIRTTDRSQPIYSEKFEVVH